jgi:hypothetical protein
VLCATLPTVATRRAFLDQVHKRKGMEGDRREIVGEGGVMKE